MKHDTVFVGNEDHVPGASRQLNHSVKEKDACCSECDGNCSKRKAKSVAIDIKEAPDNLLVVPDVDDTAAADASYASRRDFLGKGMLAALATGVLTACGKSSAAVAESSSGTAVVAPPPAARSAREISDEMDAMHEKGIKAFPAKTEGKGGLPLEYRMDGKVKVFEMTSKIAKWETEPGKFADAWTYNGMVPGPLIRVTEGERVRIILHNELPESTAIHFHGLEVPFDQDGVPFISQPPIKPGESYTYEFVVPNSGSHMYHSHNNSTKQVGMGLLGAFVVDPKDKSKEPKVDVDYVMILNDGLNGYTLNGKGFPATEPIKAKLGQTVRIRYMNEGQMIHPMHLHGMHQTVIAKDGWPQPFPWKCDTVNVAPGERWDVLVKCNNPGSWPLHCHVLSHAEGPHGMFGMVTLFIVE